MPTNIANVKITQNDIIKNWWRLNYYIGGREVAEPSPSAPPDEFTYVYTMVDPLTSVLIVGFVANDIAAYDSWAHYLYHPLINVYDKNFLNLGEWILSYPPNQQFLVTFRNVDDTENFITFINYTHTHPSSNIIRLSINSMAPIAFGGVPIRGADYIVTFKLQ